MENQIFQNLYSNYKNAFENIAIAQETNNGKTNNIADLCIHQIFEAQVEKSPDATAVIFLDPPTQLTYRQLNQRANKLAHYLRNLGIGPEVLVGIHMERSLEMIIALLGVLKAGGAYVPLDPAYPPERLAFILEDTKTALKLDLLLPIVRDLEV
jgi:non-ribosomal peptide synthetase component F